MDPISLTLVSLLAGAIPAIWRILRENSRIGGYIEKLEKDEKFLWLLDILRIKLPKPKESYEARMDKLITKFGEVSTESDQIINEFETNLKIKKSVVDELNKQYQDYLQKIEELKKAPEFINLQIREKLDKMDVEQKRDSQKGTFRDYALFALGVLTPFVFSWLAGRFHIPFLTP